MKTCECGGMWIRHSKVLGMDSLPAGMRYRCKNCRKFITVRGGKIMEPKRSGPRINDWRTETPQEKAT